ncbi:conjugal transfer protein TraG N-terminal domain-containing protein [Vibrio splendidus]|uniref:conjugal transfer protein TraG N-terminal domain-containing protein n=1 Tax=Vibrio splendidus TaxID=29497 RepID=UPI002469567F|nr:conjugal transfer protein TraG N-terminal domain-containing protein [Vibrio splendidus]MDH5938885.1 conjugal transfer protein TraG N-terminal domain-containing protein [Vibrio splendidus]
MEFLIYTIGNFDWARQVFLGLSMAFDPSTGDFGQANYLFGLGLVLSFFVAALKQFFEKGQIGGEFLGTVAKGYLIWMLCFYPRVDIVVEHAGTGESAYFTDIPVGLAIGGAVSTQVPIAFIDILSDIFVMPQNSGTHLDALRTLVAIEGSVNSPNIRTIGHADSDFIRSMDSYMNGCLFKDMEVGGAYQEAKVSNVLTNIDAWAAMEVSSTIWFINMYLEGQASFMSCKDSYIALSAYIDNDQSKLADGLDELNESKGITAGQVSSALQQLGSASMDSYTFQMNNFLDYHVKKNAIGLDASHSARGQLVDAMEYQAKQQRLFTMAGDRNLWLEMAPATISFFEAFVWFAAPLMSFFIIFGDGGFKIAVSYMRFLVLVGLYPFVMILINFYLDWSIQDALETSIAEKTVYTIGGLSNFYSEARSYIATASYMTTMVPMLAYMLLKGGEYATVSMAGKIGGTAHVNPSAVAPDIAIGAKNGSLRMGNHGWTMGDNGVVHSTSQIQDQNMPVLGGMSNMTSNLSQTSSMAESRIQSTQATHQQSWGKLSQLMTQIQKGTSVQGSETGQYSENAQFASKIQTGLQKNTNLDTQEITQLMGKLMMGGGGSGSGNFGWGSGEGTTQQSSESAKTTNQVSDSTQYTNGQGSKTISQTPGEKVSNGRNGRGTVTKSNNVQDTSSSKADRVQVTDSKSNDKSTNKTSRVGKTSKSDFSVGLDGRVQVNAEGGFNLTEREAEALQASLGYVTSEQGGTGAQYTSQEAIQKVHGLSRTTGWGETGQNAISDLKSYASAKQFQESTSHALGVAKSLNQNYSTNFTNAANNDEFKDWVVNGYNTQNEMANLSPEERKTVESNAQNRNLEIQRGAARYYNGDVGRAAAAYFSNEMQDQYQNVANSKDINSMKSGLMDISQKFSEADNLIGDKALGNMSKNFATMSDNLSAVKDTTSNAAVAGVPQEIAKHHNEFDKTRDTRLGDVGTLLTTKNIKDDHAENVEAARDNAGKVAPEKTEEVEAIKTATDRVNPTPISQEVKSAAKDAGGLVNDVAAGLVSQFHSATAQQLSEPARENMKHLESPLNKGADLLTRPQIATNPSARDFGLTTNSEGVYGAAVIALTSDENTLNKDGLLSDTEIKHHNNAVGNIENLRTQMSEDESFAKEVGGLASGKYTMEALEDYKLFMGGSQDGFRDVDYNNVAHVASSLGTKLSDEQVSNLSEQSEVNKNYDVVNGKLLSKHYLQMDKEDGAEHQKAYHEAKNTPNDVKLSQLETTGKEQNATAIKEAQSNGTTQLKGVNGTVANTAIPGSKPSNEPVQVPSAMNKFVETAAQSIALMEASDGSGMTDDQKTKVFDAIEKNTMTVKEGSQLFNSVGSGEVTANQAISAVEDKEQLLASNQNNGVVGESAGGNTEPVPVAPATTGQTQQNLQGNELTGMAKLASMVVSALPSTLSPTNNENDQSLSQNNGNQGTPESNTVPKQDKAGSEQTLKSQGPTAQPSTFTPAPQVSSATPQQAADTVATNPDSSQPQPATQIASVSQQKTTDSVVSNPRPVSSEQQQAPQPSTVTPATQVASVSQQKTTDSVVSNPRPVSSEQQQAPQSSTVTLATQVASATPQQATNPRSANSEQDGPVNLGKFANTPNTQADDVPNNEYKVGNQTQLAALNDPNSPTVTGSGAMDQALLESSQFSGMADGDKEIVMEAIANGQLTADEGVEVFNAVQSGEINSEDAIQIANGTKELSHLMSEQLASNNSGTQSNEPTSSVIEGRDQATTGQFQTQLASESTSQFDGEVAPYHGVDAASQVRESGSQLASTSFEAPNDGTTESSPSVFEASEQPVIDHSDTEVAMSSPNQFDNPTAPNNGSDTDTDTEMRESGAQLASTSFEALNEGTTESSPSVFEASEQPVIDHSDTEVAMSSPNQFDNSTAPYNGSDTDTEVRESGSQLASTSFEALNEGTTESSPSVFEASEQPVIDHSDTEVAMSSPNQFDNSTAPYNGSDTDTEVRESGSQLASTSFEAPNDGYTDSNSPAPNADLDNNGGKLDIAKALTTGDKTNLEMDADEIINGDKLDTVVGLGGSVGELDGDVNYDQDTKLT